MGAEVGSNTKPGLVQVGCTFLPSSSLHSRTLHKSGCVMCSTAMGCSTLKVNHLTSPTLCTSSIHLTTALSLVPNTKPNPHGHRQCKTQTKGQQAPISHSLLWAKEHKCRDTLKGLGETNYRARPALQPCILSSHSDPSSSPATPASVSMSLWGTKMLVAQWPTQGTHTALSCQQLAARESRGSLCCLDWRQKAPRSWGSCEDVWGCDFLSVCNVGAGGVLVTSATVVVSSS